MVRKIDDYLGNNAKYEEFQKVSFYKTDLINIIDPQATNPTREYDADGILALLIVALHKTTAPPTIDDIPFIDKNQAVVAVTDIKPSVSVTRGGRKQREYTFTFNVYVDDYDYFPVDRIVPDTYEDEPQPGTE